MPSLALVDVLVPFATRMADDGLVHVRAWNPPSGPVAVLAELDWPIQVADRSDGYSGPGIFTYPQYAIPAALAACAEAGITDPHLIVRLPAPPGERFLRVTDPDDPQDWSGVDADAVAQMAGLTVWPGPEPGRYTARRLGAAPPLTG